MKRSEMNVTPERNGDAVNEPTAGTRLTTMQMLYFLLHRLKGGGVWWHLYFAAWVRNGYSPIKTNALAFVCRLVLIGMLWCWILNIMATYRIAIDLACLHKRGMAMRSEPIRPHYV